MRNERLTAKELINKHFYFGVTVEELSKHIEDWNAQEVKHKTRHFIDQRDKALDERDNARIWIKSLQKERDEAQQQTKQLREGRQDILKSLFSIRDMVHGTPWAVVNKLIDQLNQYHEK